VSSVTYNVIIVNDDRDGLHPVPLTLEHPISVGDEISVVDFCELTEPEDSAVFEVVNIRHIVGEQLSELCDPYLYVQRIETSYE